MRKDTTAAPSWKRKDVSLNGSIISGFKDHELYKSKCIGVLSNAVIWITRNNILRVKSWVGNHKPGKQNSSNTVENTNVGQQVMGQEEPDSSPVNGALQVL